MEAIKIPSGIPIFVIGEFLIYQDLNDPDNYWIEKQCGEGMATSRKKFDTYMEENTLRAIKQYWNHEF